MSIKYGITGFVTAVLLLASSLHAQDEQFIRQQINTLCSPRMEGRGYINNGRERAARYIADTYRRLGVQPLMADSGYFQNYSFPVNTFPREISLRVNRKTLKPGVDYLVNAGSNGYEGAKRKIVTLDLLKTGTPVAWEKLKLSLDPGKVYYLKNIDSFCTLMSIPRRRLPQQLPKGCYIFPQDGKLVWTVATDTISATVFHVTDSVLPRHKRRASAEVRNVFVKKSKSRNVIGYVPGTAVPDSFIVITAHYDHLGRMGSEAVFPGANDNASGTAMMLNLARYYTANPQRYSIAFMAFSGEEAGLIGSGHYTDNPAFPLSAIRFLINIDMMGDATNGVTVVNATEHPETFGMLTGINDRRRYLPEVKSRGKSANSDHHPFSEKGVPAFFLYANGGPGHYHDVWDKPATLSLNKVTDVADLLRNFIGALQ